MAEYPHHPLIQEVLIAIAKASQCPQCGAVECKTRLYRTFTSVFMPGDYVPPRCTIDMSGVQ